MKFVKCKIFYNDALERAKIEVFKDNIIVYTYDYKKDCYVGDWADASYGPAPSSDEWFSEIFYGSTCKIAVLKEDRDKLVTDLVNVFNVKQVYEWEWDPTRKVKILSCYADNEDEMPIFLSWIDPWRSGGNRFGNWCRAYFYEPASQRISAHLSPDDPDVKKWSYTMWIPMGSLKDEEGLRQWVERWPLNFMPKDGELGKWIHTKMQNDLSIERNVPCEWHKNDSIPVIFPNIKLEVKIPIDFWVPIQFQTPISALLIDKFGRTVLADTPVSKIIGDRVYARVGGFKVGKDYEILQVYGHEHHAYINSGLYPSFTIRENDVRDVTEEKYGTIVAP